MGTIEYTVFDILKILLKKWYVIVICAVIFVVATIPMADASYENTLKHYENNTNFHYLLQQAEIQLASLKDVSTDILEVEEIELSSMGYNYATIYLSVVVNEKLDNYTKNSYTEGIAALLTKEDVLISLYNSISTTYDGKFDSFKDSVKVYNFPNSNIISIDIMYINEESFRSLYQDIPSVLNEYSESLYSEKIEITAQYEKYNLAPNKPNQKHMENMDAVQLATEKLVYNKTILKSPTKKTTSMKIITISALSGIMFSFLLIMVFDYLKYNKKLISEKITNEK